MTSDGTTGFGDTVIVTARSQFDLAFDTTADWDEAPIDVTLTTRATGMLSRSTGVDRYNGSSELEGLLSAPFRTRFGLVERLDPYPADQLQSILLRSAGLLEIELDADAALLLAERSRGTPRIANRFLRRARDLAQVSAAARIDEQLAQATLDRLGVDEQGLEEMDRRILRCLARAEGPVGVKTIAATVDETEDTIVEVFEPHLLRKGLLQKTARGRVVTSAGRQAAGLPRGVDASSDPAQGELW